MVFSRHTCGMCGWSYLPDVGKTLNVLLHRKKHLFAFWPESTNLCSVCLSVGETLRWITATYSLSVSPSLHFSTCTCIHVPWCCLSVLQMLMFIRRPNPWTDRPFRHQSPFFILWTVTADRQHPCRTVVNTSCTQQCNMSKTQPSDEMLQQRDVIGMAFVWWWICDSISKLHISA